MTKRRLFGLITMLILLLAVFAYGVTRLTAGDSGEKIVLDSYITAEVHTAPHDMVYLYDSNYFETSDKGDRVIITIPLPEEKKISHAVLFCSVYQCAVRLSYEGEILYHYGEEEAAKGKAIGNVLVCADIPDEAWGHALTMECLITDYADFNKLNDVTVCKAKDYTKYLLGDKAFSYLLSMAVLNVFTALLFVLLFWGRGGDLRKQGIYLSAFCVGLMLWQMGYSRMFYVLSNHVEFCGMTEYVGIFFAPAPFCMFLYYVEPNERFRKAMKLLGKTLMAFFLFATVLNYATENWHYCRLLRVVHIFIGMIAITVLLEFLFVRCKGDNKRLLIRFGILLYIVFALSDMLLFYVDTTGGLHVNKSFQSITSLGLYVFLILMLISYCIHVLEYVVSVKEKERLEQMAYQDEMTRVANRRKCLDYIESLKEKQSYTVFFFDVNNLKFANDKYGHDMGDRLILAIADLIGNVFENEGFYGRYGGDEFVAIVEYCEEDRIKGIEKRIEEEIVRINEERDFPFSVMLAYGVAGSMEGEDADEVVRLADERMYEQKWQMKKSKI